MGVIATLVTFSISVSAFSFKLQSHVLMGVIATLLLNKRRMIMPIYEYKLQSHLSMGVIATNESKMSEL